MFPQFPQPLAQWPTRPNRHSTRIPIWTSCMMIGFSLYSTDTPLHNQSRSKGSVVQLANHIAIRAHAGSTTCTRREHLAFVSVGIDWSFCLVKKFKRTISVSPRIDSFVRPSRRDLPWAGALEALGGFTVCPLTVCVHDLYSRSFISPFIWLNLARIYGGQGRRARTHARGVHVR